MKHPIFTRLFTIVSVAFILGCISISTSRICKAQIVEGTLNGTVTDPSGAVVPNVQVTVTKGNTGFSRSVRTNSSGAYYLPGLEPGVYNVSAEAQGFKTTEIPGVTLLVGKGITQDIRLEVGGAKEEVTVTAETPLLTTTTGQMGTIVTHDLISDLPLNGRNTLQLNLLSPGVIHNKNSNTTDAVTINPAGTTFSVNGQKSDFNMYLVDGVETKDWQHGVSYFVPSVDAVQEFQTTTSTYSAAMGVMAGAQVNMVVRSGTNGLHGSAFEFLRNNVLDARDFFQVGDVPPFKRNQFGANVGGPIIIPRIYDGKNKSFFFFNYEGFRQQKQVPQTGYFPTAAQLGGDLSTLATPDNPIINPFTGQAFANNIIPSDMIRPSTLEGFLQNGIGKGPWIPGPNVNLPGVNYIRDSGLNYSSNQEITRIDHMVSDKTTVYGHYIYERDRRADPNLNPNWGVTEGISTYSMAGHISHVFSPTFLFEVNVGLNHFIQNLVQSTAFTNDITNKILQIQGNATAGAAWGAPLWSVDGYSNLGEVHYGPRSWWLNTFDLRPNFTLTKGNHTLKWGLDFERMNEAFPEIFRTNGVWGYNGGFSGNPLGDFLLGLPHSIDSSPDGFTGDVYNSNISPYFADDWKVTPHLTLNLGLRYEWQGIPLSDNCRSIGNIYFPPNNGVPTLMVADDACAINFQGHQQAFYTGVPYIKASTVGYPEALVWPDNKDFAPRFGFAYRVPRSTNTVIRGGYGIFYTKDIQDKWMEPMVNPPFVHSIFVTLDQTNFQGFDPSNPYVDAASTTAAFGGNESKNRVERIQEWNLTLERTMLRNTLFSAAYVGSVSDHLANWENYNQARPGPGSVVSRRRWPTAGEMDYFGDNGIGNYNGLQLKVQHMTSKGLSLLAGYTWSKAMDNSGGTYVGESDRGNEMDFYNRAMEYGLAGQDVRQRFVISYVYQLPFGKGKPFLNRGGVGSALLGGWEINGITTAMSGVPQTATQTYNISNSDSGENRPDTIGPISLSHSRSRGQQVAEFFNTAAFQQADLTNGTYRFGNTSRHTIIGPGDYEWDFSVHRYFKFTESKQLEFRAESFNLFNRPIFGAPGSTLGTPQFGVITYTSSDPREIQFALKLSF